MAEVWIRDMEQGEEFADWFADLVEREEGSAVRRTHLEDRYLVLTNEVGDWIGGLRFLLRGGVAQLIDIGVVTEERHRGHAHGLLAALEERAADAGAHLIEFWTDDLDSEPLLGALGWRPVLQRDNYIAHRTWVLMEKRLRQPAPIG